MKTPGIAIFAFSKSKGWVMGSGKRGYKGNLTTTQQRGVSPEQAISLLKKKGIQVDEKEAEVILDFLYILAKLAVNQYFNENEG